MASNKIFLGIVIFFNCLLFYQKEGLAWGYIGHEVIASISYEQLNPAVKKEVDRLNAVLAQFYPNERGFINSASWADRIKKDDVHAFDHWHYVDLPYIVGHFQSKPLNSENVIWAIKQSEAVLRSSHSNDFEKAFFLRFLIHWVGDIHQPMHCIELYDEKWPFGDKGGNLYPIDSSFGENLHQLWDNGVGLFKSYQGKNKIQYYTHKLMQQFPTFFLKGKLRIKKASVWAKESHELAIKHAYTIPPGSKLTKQYRNNGKFIAGQRIALAGYRLALMLNTLLDNSQENKVKEDPGNS